MECWGISERHSSPLILGGQEFGCEAYSPLKTSEREMRFLYRRSGKSTIHEWWSLPPTLPEILNSSGFASPLFWYRVLWLHGSKPHGEKSASPPSPFQHKMANGWRPICFDPSAQREKTPHLQSSSSRDFNDPRKPKLTSPSNSPGEASSSLRSILMPKVFRAPP